MAKSKLLYISFNDGTDTRITKEIRSLSRSFDVDFIGIGSSGVPPFVRPWCKRISIVKGRHNYPYTLFLFYMVFLKYYFSKPYSAFHVINEPLLWLFYPFFLLSRKKVVLDLFDSWFLKKCTGSELGVRFLKDITYSLPAFLVVTDELRRQLLPSKFRPKALVVPNYPYPYIEEKEPYAKGTEELLLFFGGSLFYKRGIPVLEQLLESDSRVKILMAGWINDSCAHKFAGKENVEYLGVLSQEETTKIASCCDYIVALYEPDTLNQIYASPNKVYDALQVKTPLLINGELKVASFVKENALGYVLDGYEVEDVVALVQALFRSKNSYHFSESLRQQYTWKYAEKKLLQVHGCSDPGN